MKVRALSSFLITILLCVKSEANPCEQSMKTKRQLSTYLQPPKPEDTSYFYYTHRALPNFTKRTIRQEKQNHDVKYEDHKTSQTTHFLGPHQIETIQTEDYHKEVPAFDVSHFKQEIPNDKHGEVHYHHHQHIHHHAHQQEHVHQHKNDHEHKHIHQQKHAHEHHSNHHHNHHQEHKHHHNHGHKNDHKHNHKHWHHKSKNH